MARDPPGDGSIALSQVVEGGGERRLARDLWKVPPCQSHEMPFVFTVPASQTLPTFSETATMEGGG